MHTVSDRSLCDFSLWWLLFVIQDGADHRKSCFPLLSFPEISHYLRLSGYDVFFYFRVNVVTSCVWSTIQCQGSHSHREQCILWHCLDLGDYPRVSRKFLDKPCIPCPIVRYAIFHYGGCYSSSRTVQTIGRAAFHYCLSLKSATISGWVDTMSFFISVSML